MLAELNVLLHEMSDSLRSRSASVRPHPRDLDPRAFSFPERSVLVTGVPSPGKARLIEGLSQRLAAAGIGVKGARGHASDGIVLHVHAETDLEAMLEGEPQSTAAAASRDAELIVPVDWEPAARSVDRIVEALISRGASAAGLGA